MCGVLVKRRGIAMLTKKQKKMLIRIIIAGICFVILEVLEHTALHDVIHGNVLLALVLYGVPYVIVAADVFEDAFHNIRHGQIFDEHLLMIIATFGAFVVAEYAEALAVMLFYQVGELFQGYAVGKSRASISDLMNIVPEYANIEVDGELTQVDPDDVEVGTVIVVKPGEKIPLDGIVEEGESMIDTSALTGESVPRRVRAGEEVSSGCVNGGNTLKIRTTREFDDSTVARILELVENAGNKKAQVEKFITRFARVYTPAVTIAAVCLALIPPLILGGGFLDWMQRACVFLVVSCPCALVISVPLGFFGGIGASSSIGILVKGGNYLEEAASLVTMVFDKTGTLTRGEFRVTEVKPAGSLSEAGLLELAAHAEGYSTHPIAESIRKAYAEQTGKAPDMDRVSETEEIAGHGIIAVIDGRRVLAGNLRLLAREGIEAESAGTDTIVYLACDGVYAGSVTIADTLKPGVQEAIAGLKAEGVRNVVMLTGDRREAAASIAEAAGITEVRAELLPGDKVSAVESLLTAENEKEYLGFVGDGINDAPVIMRADVGFAMGSMGSDAAIEAADIVIMDDDISKIPAVIRIARKTMRIVRMNIVFALGVKLVVLVLGALGIANMWAAVFADVGVAVIAILNSMRTLRLSEEDRARVISVQEAKQLKSSD